MHTDRLDEWQHSHVFGQDQQRAGEKRTLLVVGLTATMMVIEIVTGLLYGSMALLADGLHMGSHALALGIAVFAYVFSRRSATDRSYSFGVGKINSLAGFASAVLLMGFALLMITESTDRLINPLPISFDQALIVAVIGLFVNGASAWILMSTPHEHGHGHGHGHGHSHDHHHDHNLRAAYLHVLADALTSILAIVALLAGKYFAANWLDPAMGFVGAALVARWSFGLIKDSSRVLLDREASDKTLELRQSIEGNTSDRIADLHLWSIGHGILAAEITVVSDNPATPAHYKSLIPDHLNVVHVTVEVHQCAGHLKT
ncbi:MAG: CDF family Co(II)/Ni(II) efflux transporter DmeF [Gammaproteobacteria bacterium]|nr:CDF family Co(II)/Ni(II) efflux transporter DmeF [Gammaproteobacteria bacterium]